MSSQREKSQEMLRGRQTNELHLDLVLVAAKMVYSLSEDELHMHNRMQGEKHTYQSKKE